MFADTDLARTADTWKITSRRITDQRRCQANSFNAYDQRWQKTSPQCLQRVSQGQAANYPDKFEITFNQMTNMKGDEI